MLSTLLLALPFVGETNLSQGLVVVFFICFIAVLGFEFVNGFHDTANAVATVIYTNTLKHYPAIIWSGIWNFLGVFVVGTAVAMSLLKLIPLDTLITLPVQAGACLVISILLSSIMWNLSTWFLGIPLSSSHTLIGAMIGASIAFGHFYGTSVNWSKAGEIGLSLLISPVIGFAGAALLMYLVKHFTKGKQLFHIPKNDKDKPPMHIRALLITTCTLVSFFHGSNDGQKGVGLLMLVLIAFMPVTFAFNPKYNQSQTLALLHQTEQTAGSLPAQNETVSALKLNLAKAIKEIGSKNSAQTKEKFAFRKQVQTISGKLKLLADDKSARLNKQSRKQLANEQKDLQKVTDYAPVWVLACISISLGLGTMIGWKRIVVTIGERIGTKHLNYAEGASAEIIAAATIGLSTSLGLPVSTTHVLSSGVAGAMTASDGLKNLNKKTVKTIATAWILTLPAAIGLSWGLFMLFHLFI